MYKKCIQAGLRVTHELVAETVCLVDPDGVELRKRRKFIRRRYYAKEPNSVWHIDPYEELKPYGICISACIDGYSRNVLWAEAYFTNSDPAVIATYFLDAVEFNSGCPQKIRMDAGTENGTVAKVQRVLTDDDSSVIIGVSTVNIRIESWWGQYRTSNAEYFTSMFHELLNTGDFSGDDVDKELMRFCFLAVVQVCVEYYILLFHERLFLAFTVDPLISVIH